MLGAVGGRGRSRDHLCGARGGRRGAPRLPRPAPAAGWGLLFTRWGVRPWAPALGTDAGALCLTV